MNKVDFDVITLYPNGFDNLNNMGVITRAIKNKLISINITDLREYGEGSQKQVDDPPYGGGAGMLLKPEPIFNAFESIHKSEKNITLLMTPQGKVLKQEDLSRWSTYDQIILICGQYEGFDERVRCLADEEISLGDFILTGGEIPAMSIINGVTRLIPGTLGDINSLNNESHNNGFLEYPQYTRPARFKGMEVPSILLSGNHKEISAWRKRKMIERTLDRRNDLILTEDFNSAVVSKKIKKDKYDLMNFRICNEYDNYPDW